MSYSVVSHILHFSGVFSISHSGCADFPLPPLSLFLQCSFFEYRGYKIAYRRYASLFFVVGADEDENELAVRASFSLFLPLHFSSLE